MRNVILPLFIVPISNIYSALHWLNQIHFNYTSQSHFAGKKVPHLGAHVNAGNLLRVVTIYASLGAAKFIRRIRLSTLHYFPRNLAQPSHLSSDTVWPGRWWCAGREALYVYIRTVCRRLAWLTNILFYIVLDPLRGTSHDDWLHTPSSQNERPSLNDKIIVRSWTSTVRTRAPTPQETFGWGTPRFLGNWEKRTNPSTAEK